MNAPECCTAGCTAPATHGTFGPALCADHARARGTPLAPDVDRLEIARRSRLTRAELAREEEALS